MISARLLKLCAALDSHVTVAGMHDMSVLYLLLSTHGM